MLVAVATAVLVVTGTLVLLAAALAPRLGRAVPADVVAPPRTAYGRAPVLLERARSQEAGHPDDHDLAA
ncbi:hypothetical protein WDZ17_07820 [Pseudokineococcus basanitobsidens]|uniref:Uncharacterized protein n=1 Tax=Pseudokineococcus basanitobsidens TaxID=1926649 RepID=A0ABU8RJG7_9ACTN